MKVSIAYAEPRAQYWVDLELEEGATVGDAIEISGVLKRFPEIDLESQRVGIFGKASKLDKPLSEGDRVEIYRPIIADPDEVERRDQ